MILRRTTPFFFGRSVPQGIGSFVPMDGSVGPGGCVARHRVSVYGRETGGCEGILDKREEKERGYGGGEHSREDLGEPGLAVALVLSSGDSGRAQQTEKGSRAGPAAHYACHESGVRCFGTGIVRHSSCFHHLPDQLDVPGPRPWRHGGYRYGSARAGTRPSARVGPTGGCGASGMSYLPIAIDATR